MFISQYQYQEVCDLLLESEEQCERLVKENERLGKWIEELEKGSKNRKECFIVLIGEDTNYIGLPEEPIVVRAFKIDDVFRVTGLELINKGADTLAFERCIFYNFTKEQVKCLL